MRNAITRLGYDPADQADTPEHILQGTYLRPILLRSFSTSTALAHTPTSLQASDEVEYLPHDTLDHASRLSDEHEGVFRDDMRISSWAKRYSKPNPVRVEGDPELSLNATQIRAVAMMIGERISLVQGVSRRSVPAFDTLSTVIFIASRYRQDKDDN